jgi:type IV secretion system protein TrbI
MATSIRSRHSAETVLEARRQGRSRCQRRRCEAPWRAEREPGADPEGYAGLEDEVDNHWGMLFKASILSALLSVGSETGANNNESALVQALRQRFSHGLSQVGEQVVGRSLNVEPTITIRPGFPVRVIVNRDLVLEPYAG